MESGVTPVHDPAAFLQRWHYWGLFVVILAEESGIPLPIPGDLFIAAMGFLASTGPEQSRWTSFLEAALVVTGATVLGASILYLLSRRFGHRLLTWAGRWLGYDQRKQARLEAWLHRNGFLAVVVGRLIPGLRIVMTVVAGALRLPHATFSLGTMVAGLVWATIYFWLGYVLGSGYQRLAGEGHMPPWAVFALLAVAVAVLVLLMRRRARARHPVDGRPPAHPG
jgi:membrane protein DedA with SNARE-associated domain